MITEKIYGKYTETGKKTDCVTVEWFERDRKILRKTTSSGEEIGIRINETLNQNDIIFEDDEKLIYVDIAPCELISVSIQDIKQMGRLCFELGNRHLSLSIAEDCVRCPYDAPTLEYLKKLGFNAVKTHEKFEGYIECRAHSHSHHSHEHSHEH